MNSWLIINEFLGGEKYEGTRQLFYDSAKRHNIQMKTVTNSQLIKIPKELPDFGILWDKDYCAGKRLEDKGLRLFNSAKAMAVCDDKAYTYMKLEDKIPMPKTLITPMTFMNIGYTNTDFLQTAIEVLGLPLVIKERHGSFGQQVYLANTKEEARKILSEIGGKGSIMQEMIQTSYGVDLRLNVVGKKVVSAIKRQGEGFISNLSSGGKATPYTPTQAEIDLAIKAVELLKLDFGGVDILIGKDGPLLCEVNSNLQFRSSYEVTGIDLADHIFDYICDTLK